jgi:hypothetical protein
VFRNAWSDSFYGADGRGWADYNIGNNFNGLTGWDESDAVVFAGNFADAVLRGNGTYRVMLTEFDFDGDEEFRLLFVSTNVPMHGNPLTFTNVKLTMDGNDRYMFAQAFIPGIDNNERREFYELQIINTYSAGFTADHSFNTLMPTQSIMVEFTVSGFNYDRADDGTPDVTPPPAPTRPPDAPAADYMPPPPTPDNDDFPVWGIVLIIVGVVVVAGGAVAAVLILNKKKKNGGK